MLDEKSHKQIISTLERIHFEKEEQLNIVKTSQELINSFDKASKQTETIIASFFNERNQKIENLNEQLQQAISQNDKDTIIKITKILGDLKV
ncbi:hypothetical protein [Caryophanon latum]|uniref:Uncharacterized protein n=1 Tax=Caryophanon latum TaxID=33977 RepID=A0A1C0YX28_9BACL|nr:hypothetical protein [Caryophanon latum]OCS91706.1 hypothetical protein A6K76_08220 [Caryophanon latum]